MSLRIGVSSFVRYKTDINFTLDLIPLQALRLLLENVRYIFSNHENVSCQRIKLVNCETKEMVFFKIPIRN